MPTAYAVEEIAALIDHAVLKPEATDADLAVGVEVARRCRVASICAKPCHVAAAARDLEGDAVAVGTVIAFPHGSATLPALEAESRQAIADGAVELDMVANVGKVLSGDWHAVRDAIAAVQAVAAAGGALVKVIFENCYLADEHKVRLCERCSEIGVAYVKTSTGFGPGGAAVDDVRLMARSVAPGVGVKAAGGIRTLDDLLAMRAAGATRIGASATAAILDEARRRAGDR